MDKCHQCNKDGNILRDGKDRGRWLDTLFITNGKYTCHGCLDSIVFEDTADSITEKGKRVPKKPNKNKKKKKTQKKK